MFSELALPAPCRVEAAYKISLIVNLGTCIDARLAVRFHPQAALPDDKRSDERSLLPSVLFRRR